MSFREVLNITVLVFLTQCFFGLFFLLRDVVQHQAISWGFAVYLPLTVLPFIVSLVTGLAYGIDFIVILTVGGGKSSKGGFSIERGNARRGTGKEIAHAYLWRDFLFGDTHGLFAILEMAQLNEELKPEATRAVVRLLRPGRLNRTEKNHLGHLYNMANMSEARESYSHPYDPHKPKKRRD